MASFIKAFDMIEYRRFCIETVKQWEHIEKLSESKSMYQL